MTHMLAASHASKAAVCVYSSLRDYHYHLLLMWCPDYLRRSEQKLKKERKAWFYYTIETDCMAYS